MTMAELGIRLGGIKFSRVELPPDIQRIFFNKISAIKIFIYITPRKRSS